MTAIRAPFNIDVLNRVRGVLTATGHVAVAIENRYAMETLAGMADTHTGLRLLPALPNMLARALYRVKKGGRLRSWLRSRNEYEHLFRRVGFPSVRTLETVSSYNDYDFVLDTQDSASYALLWRHECVRGFYPRAHTWRWFLGRVLPGALNRVAYAYAVVGGPADRLLLDASHEIWAQARELGADPGTSRFGCQYNCAGCVVLVAHDGERVTAIIEVGLALTGGPGGIRDRVPAGIQPLVVAPRFLGGLVSDGIEVRVDAGT